MEVVGQSGMAKSPVKLLWLNLGESEEKGKEVDKQRQTDMMYPQRLNSIVCTKWMKVDLKEAQFLGDS